MSSFYSPHLFLNKGALRKSRLLNVKIRFDLPELGTISGGTEMGLLD
jgi:hypothetical protein